MTKDSLPDATNTLECNKIYKTGIMSFAGFVFDMIRRDKENRDLRNLRKERLDSRLDKMYKGHNNIPRNTTAEDMKRYNSKRQEKKRQS